MARIARFIIYFIPLVVLISLVLFFWQGAQQKKPAEIPLRLLNEPLPTFNAMTLNDDPLVKTSNQDFLGHLTLLNVWASGCVPCQVEHKELMAIAHSRKIYLYGLTYKDSREAALSYLQKMGNPYFLVIHDPKGDFALNLGVSSIPETFLIDQNGIIRYKYTKPITREIWQKELLPLIESLSDNSRKTSL